MRVNLRRKIHKQNKNPSETMDLLNQHDLEKALDTTLNSMKEKTIEMKSCF